MFQVLQRHNREDVGWSHDLLLKLLENDEAEDQTHDYRDDHVGDVDRQILLCKRVEIGQSVVCDQIVHEGEGVVKEVGNQIYDVLNLGIIDVV